MKEIVAKSGGDAKLRLRGKGSGFMERDTKSESNEALQLCISCPRAESYDIAVRGTEELLRRIYTEYDQWCQERGKPERAPELRMSERHHRGEAGDGSGGGGGGGGAGRNRRGGRNRRPRGKPAIGGAEKGPEGDVWVNANDDDSSDDNSTGASAERGTAPSGAPPTEEIERLIEMRNVARKKCDFREADRIRDDLRNRGVVLSDEKGGHGSGLTVTSWRYWKD